MKIIFDEVGHTYTDEHGNIIPSVTQILGKVYGTGLESAPSYFVERAAEKGTQIHNEIEAYLKTGKEGKTPEFKVWLKWFSFGGTNLYTSEQVVYATTTYGTFAGTVDFFSGFVYDWKTCKTATRKQIDKWQKQLSFYCYALRKMGKAVNEPLKIVHITDKVEVINVDYLGDKFVEETMRLYSENEKPAEVTYELETVSHEELASLEEMMLSVTKAEKLMETIREKIKREMERRGILSLSIGNVNMTYVAGTVRSSFDSKAFKQDHNDLYEQYKKAVEVKPSLRITIKE